MRLGYFTSSRVWGGAEAYLDSMIRGAAPVHGQITVFCSGQYPYADGSMSKPDGCRLVIYSRNADDSAGESQDCGSLTLGSMWRRLVPLWMRKAIAAYQIKVAARVYKEVPYYRRLFREHPVDIMHINEVCASAAIAAKLEGIPVIIGTYHSLKPDDDWTLVEWVLMKLSMMVFTQGIAVSEAAREDWARISKSVMSKTRVIYNGIDISSFERDRNVDGLKQELSIEDQTPIIGITARLVYAKGHRYLIEAAHIVKKKIPDAVFLIVGDGPLRKELGEYVSKLNLSENFRFLGFRSDISRLTHIYDISVLPSVREGLGNVLIEAMVCGKPVIGTNVGGIPEVIEDGETGYIIEPRDPGVLAQSIVELLRNREKAERMGRAGRKRAERMFQESRMVEETLALYERLFLGRGLGNSSIRKGVFNEDFGYRGIRRGRFPSCKRVEES